MSNLTPAARLDDELLELLRTEFEAPADITLASTYEEMDFDSLVLVEIAVILSQRYDIAVTDSDMHEVATVAATLALLRANGVAG